MSALPPGPLFPPVGTFIKFGTITPDNVNGQFAELDQDGQPSPFTDYIVRNRFESDKHVYMMGVTSPGGLNGQAAAFVQFSVPTLLWIADWTCARWLNKPIIQDVNLPDTDWVLLDEHYEPGQLMMAPDGNSPFFRISGTFVYGKKNPSSATINDINFARPPHIKGDIDRTVSSQILQQGIINIVNSTLRNIPNPGQGAAPGFPGG
jgi:hypothetical protein